MTPSTSRTFLLQKSQRNEVEIVLLFVIVVQQYVLMLFNCTYFYKCFSCSKTGAKEFYVPVLYQDV